VCDILQNISTCQWHGYLCILLLIKEIVIKTNEKSIRNHQISKTFLDKMKIETVISLCVKTFAQIQFADITLLKYCKKIFTPDSFLT